MTSNKRNVLPLFFFEYTIKPISPLSYLADQNSDLTRVPQTNAQIQQKNKGDQYRRNVIPGEI